MNLQREKVVVIKRDHYEEPSGVLDLPKRETYLTIPPIHNAHMDVRAVPTERKSPEFPRWVTHMAILELFVKKDPQNWLLVLEDHLDFQTHHIQQLQSVATQTGVYTLSDDGGCYLIDKATAKIVLEQNKLFYAPIYEVFNDLKKLDIILTYEPFKLDTINNYKWYSYLPFILLALAAVLIFFYINSVKELVMKVGQQLTPLRNAYGSAML